MKVHKTHTLLGCLLLLVSVSKGNADQVDAAYVANWNDNTVSVIGRDRLDTLATIPVGGHPSKLAASPDGKWVFVSNESSNNISVIDTAARRVVATIPVGNQPHGMTVSPDNNYLYVLNAGSASMSVIDIPSGTVTKVVPTASTPVSVVHHPQRPELWISYDGTPTVLEVREATNHSVLGSIRTTSRVYASSGMAFTPDGSSVWTAENCGCCGRFHRLAGSISGGSVAPIETDVLYDNLGAAYAVAMNPATALAYLAKSGHCGGTPTVYESSTGRKVRLPAIPRDMAIDAPRGQLWVALGNGMVAVVDTETLTTIATVPAGARPEGLALAPFGSSVSDPSPNLLVNGSFESPTLPVNTRSIMNPAGWSGPASPIIVNGLVGVGFPQAEDREQYAALGVYNDGSRATLSQAFTITNRGSYVLTWFDNAAHEPLPLPPITANYSVTVFDATGAPITSLNLNAWHDTPDWVSHSMWLNLSDGAYTLTFRPLGTPGVTASLIDNVTLLPEANRDLLVNGSFESPALPMNTRSIVNPAGWSGPASPIIVNGLVGVGFPHAQDRQQYAALGVYNDGSRATLSQTFTVINPGTFALAWFDNAAHEPLPPPPITANYSVTILNDRGTAVSSTNLNAWHNAPDWVPHLLWLNLGAGTYTLKFQPLGTPGVTASLIDNVSLQPEAIRNLLVNGSLESPTLPVNTRSIVNPMGWSGPASPIIVNGLVGVGFPQAQDRQQYAALGVYNDGSRATLSQAFTVAKPGMYELTWFDNAAHEPLPLPPITANYSVTILNDSGSVVVSTNLNAWHNTPDWVLHSMWLNLNVGTYTLKFQPLGTPGVTASLIDNVALLIDSKDNADLRATIQVSAVNVCWPGRIDQTYQVKYRTTLSVANWVTLGSPIRGNGTNCVTDWIEGTQQRYYRIDRVP